MKSPAEIIRQLLVDLELVQDSQDATWSAFVGFLPDSPDCAVCVYDTEGRPDGRIMGSGEQIEHPGIQIRIRGPVYRTVWDKVKEIADALSANSGVTVAFESEDAYLVHNISRTGGIMTLGVEVQGSRRNHNFAINAVVTLSYDTDESSTFVGSDWAPYWVRNT